MDVPFILSFRRAHHSSTQRMEQRIQSTPTAVPSHMPEYKRNLQSALTDTSKTHSLDPMVSTNANVESPFVPDTCADAIEPATAANTIDAIMIVVKVILMILRERNGHNNSSEERKRTIRRRRKSWAMKAERMPRKGEAKKRGSAERNLAMFM